MLDVGRLNSYAVHLYLAPAAPDGEMEIAAGGFVHFRATPRYQLRERTRLSDEIPLEKVPQRNKRDVSQIDRAFLAKTVFPF